MKVKYCTTCRTATEHELKTVVENGNAITMLVCKECGKLNVAKSGMLKKYGEDGRK